MVFPIGGRGRQRWVGGGGGGGCGERLWQRRETAEGGVLEGEDGEGRR